MAFNLSSFLGGIFSNVSSLVSSVMTSAGAGQKAVDTATAAINGAAQIVTDATSGTHDPAKIVSDVSSLVGNTIGAAGAPQKIVDTATAAIDGAAKIVSDVSSAIQAALHPAGGTTATAGSNPIQALLDSIGHVSASVTPVAAPSVPAPAIALSHDVGNTAADLLAQHPAITHIG